MRKFYINTQGTFLVSNIPCVLKRVIINGSAGATITLKDGNQPFAVISQIADVAGFYLEYNCVCEKNLEVVTSAAIDVTLVFENAIYR